MRVTTAESTLRSSPGDCGRGLAGVRGGYNGRVHLKVVSRRFNGMNERQKQQVIWEILNTRLGADAQAVSLAMVYGTDEL